MSFEFTDKVVKIEGWYGNHKTKFGAIDKAVLLDLAERANKDNQTWAGYTRLCKRTYYSRAAVSKAIQNLHALGLISISPPTEDRRTNTYTLNYDKICEAAGVDADSVKGKGKLSGRRFTRKPSISTAEVEIPSDEVMGGGWHRCNYGEFHHGRCDCDDPVGLYVDSSSSIPAPYLLEDDDDELA